MHLREHLVQVFRDFKVTLSTEKSNFKALKKRSILKYFTNSTNWQKLWQKLKNENVGSRRGQDTENLINLKIISR